MPGKRIDGDDGIARHHSEEACKSGNNSTSGVKAGCLVFSYHFG